MAGEDYEKARYYPQDAEFLLEFEPNVKHYDMFDETDNLGDTAGDMLQILKRLKTVM